jgi:two-component system, response regulator PdtaR
MCHVLIIEDEPLIALLIQEALEEVGATSFEFATTEQEAVDRALQQRPAVISADVRLNEGDGLRAVRKIRMKLGWIPVMFITGSPDECKPLDDGAVISKPLSFASIHAAFERITQHGPAH